MYIYLNLPVIWEWYLPEHKMNDVYIVLCCLIFGIFVYINRNWADFLMFINMTLYIYVFANWWAYAKSPSSRYKYNLIISFHCAVGQ